MGDQATVTPAPADTKLPAADVAASKLPKATVAKDGVSIICNLPHGLTIKHAGKSLTLAGSNADNAITTSTDVSGKWGVTNDVDEDWFDDWAKLEHPAVVNGLIVKTIKAKAQAAAEARGDSVKTGADQIDPKKPGEGVEPATDKDGGTPPGA